MKKVAGLFALLALLFCVQSAWAAQGKVNGVRLWAAPDHTRLVFDTSGPVSHKVFSLSNPSRLVVDVKNAHMAAELPRISANARYLLGIRHARWQKTDLRIVLDLKAKVRARSFQLKPNNLYGHRLVLDLEPKTGAAPKPVKQVESVSEKSERGRDLLIAIDAGHGGEDPGASGPSGIKEKDVVLKIARELERIVRQEPGMQPFMVRDGDYFLSLQRRREKAREAKADLFISIHADAFRDQRVRGSSVYTLSQRGASSEAARWLAAKENHSDLVGGVELDDKDDLLASVLLDLSMSATMEASREAADRVLAELRRVNKLHKRRVQHAGFKVLKSPDMPSMLVETAFISNPGEEARLSNKQHQKRLAEALLGGVRSYFRTYPPDGSWIAQNVPKKHVISNGDTLSEIAQQYSLSVRDLRQANNLRGDRIRIGQVLTIPGS